MSKEQLFEVMGSDPTHIIQPTAPNTRFVPSPSVPPKSAAQFDYRECPACDCFAARFPIKNAILIASTSQKNVDLVVGASKQDYN